MTVPDLPESHDLGAYLTFDGSGHLRVPRELVFDPTFDVAGLIARKMRERAERAVDGGDVTA